MNLKSKSLTLFVFTVKHMDKNIEFPPESALETDVLVPINGFEISSFHSTSVLNFVLSAFREQFLCLTAVLCTGHSQFTAEFYKIQLNAPFLSGNFFQFLFMRRGCFNLDISSVLRPLKRNTQAPSERPNGPKEHSWMHLCLNFASFPVSFIDFAIFLLIT